MQLLVKYTLKVFDELSDKTLFLHRMCSVNCPELTHHSDFLNFVKDNKYDSIFLMEKDCIGSLELEGMIINDVDYLPVL